MDDDDLWDPPIVLKSDDSPRKRIPRGYVLEENYQNVKYCEMVRRILDEKKKIDDEVSIQASSGSGGLRDITLSDSDKTLSGSLHGVDTSSAKSVLDEDENTSSISDAQTIVTSDSDGIDLDTRVKPQEIALVAKDLLIVEVTKEADISSSPVLASKIEEAEEHSCSSLVSDQMFDPIKKAPENKSSSAVSQESIGGSVLENREKVGEKANATNKDGELSKEADIVTVSEPFTTESLLDMCDEPDKGKVLLPWDESSKTSLPGAVKSPVGKDELIINLVRPKAGSNPMLNPGLVLLKKKQSVPNSSDNKGMFTSFIRNTKQKVASGAAVKNTTQSVHEIIRGSNVPNSDSIERINQRGEKIMIDPVVTVRDLQNKTGKELRKIAQAWKVTRYYKLKKEDLLEQLTKHLTDCTKEKMEP